MRVCEQRQQELHLISKGRRVAGREHLAERREEMRRTIEETILKGGYFKKWSAISNAIVGYTEVVSGYCAVKVISDPLQSSFGKVLGQKPQLF